MEYIIENADRIQFRDMSKVDQHTILDAKLNAPESVEMYCGDYWGKTSGASLVFEYIYRVQAIDTPLNIPWEVISPEWNWAAMDECGEPFIFGSEPQISEVCFTGIKARNIDFLCPDTTGIDWRRSKTRRPV